MLLYKRSYYLNSGSGPSPGTLSAASPPSPEGSQEAKRPGGPWSVQEAPVAVTFFGNLANPRGSLHFC